MTISTAINTTLIYSDIISSNQKPIELNTSSGDFPPYDPGYSRIKVNNTKKSTIIKEAEAFLIEGNLAIPENVPIVNAPAEDFPFVHLNAPFEEDLPFAEVTLPGIIIVEAEIIPELPMEANQELFFDNNEPSNNLMLSYIQRYVQETRNTNINIDRIAQIISEERPSILHHLNTPIHSPMFINITDNRASLPDLYHRALQNIENLYAARPIDPIDLNVHGIVDPNYCG